MEITFNPSGLIQSLEYNLHKGVSRSKTEIQKQMRDWITEADRITEQKSSAYRTEAMVMVACAVGMIALSMIGAGIDSQLESIKSELNINPNNFPPIERIFFTCNLTYLENMQKKLTSCKMVSNVLNLGLQKGSEVFSCLAKILLTNLDHRQRKQEIYLSQLQQEQHNSAIQSLLSEVKDMKRRQQQAKAAAG